MCCRSPSTNVMWVTSDVEMWWGGLWWHLGISARYGLSITPDTAPLGDPHLCTYIALLQTSREAKPLNPEYGKLITSTFFLSIWSFSFFLGKWKFFLLTLQDSISHINERCFVSLTSLLYLLYFCFKCFTHCDYSLSYYAVSVCLYIYMTQDSPGICGRNVISVCVNPTQESIGICSRNNVTAAQTYLHVDYEFDR